MQIIWKITGLNREVSTGIVRSSGWLVTVEHNGVSNYASGQSEFYAEIAAIPYNELTESVVLQWVWSMLGNDKVKIETQLCRQLEDREFSETSAGLPWSTE